MNRIKTLRSTQTPKMSQEKLGQLVGVGRTTVAMWEGGKSEPDNATLAKLAEIFCVSVDYLLGLTDEKEKLPTESEELSDAELDLVNAYRDAPANVQAAIRTLLERR